MNLSYHPAFSPLPASNPFPFRTSANSSHHSLKSPRFPARLFRRFPRFFDSRLSKSSSTLVLRIRAAVCLQRTHSRAARVRRFFSPFLHLRSSRTSPILCTAPISSPNPCIIRTYEISSHNPFRIRTYRKPVCKLFRIRTYAPPSDLRILKDLPFPNFSRNPFIFCTYRPPRKCGKQTTYNPFRIRTYKIPSCKSFTIRTYKNHRGSTSLCTAPPARRSLVCPLLTTHFLPRNTPHGPRSAEKEFRIHLRRFRKSQLP